MEETQKNNNIINNNPVGNNGGNFVNDSNNTNSTKSLTKNQKNTNNKQAKEPGEDIITNAGIGINLSTENKNKDAFEGSKRSVKSSLFEVNSKNIISLKNGKTQKEIDEENKLSELKKNAIKLEKKPTNKELQLKQIKKNAIKIFNKGNKQEKKFFGKLEVKKDGRAVLEKESIKPIKTEEEKQEEWRIKKVNLSKLTPEQKLEIQVTPSLASVNFDMNEDTNGQMENLFKQYDRLPINIKIGLSSNEIKEKITNLAKKYNILTEKGAGEIARIVREIYIKLISTNEIKERLQDILQIDKDDLGSVINEIAEIVQLVKEVGAQKSNAYYERLTIKEAIEKYTTVSEQEITERKIIDKKTRKYIKPTVYNWLENYIDQMGSERHTKLERGKYLDDSINTKKLGEEELDCLNKIIKSYDEETKLIIDPEEGVIMCKIHDDENILGISPSKNKRVINKFKIEDAQTVDIDSYTKDVDLEKKQKKGIIENRNKKTEEGILDLSSELEKQ